MPEDTASGSQHSMGYILEAAYGVTPATPAFKFLRHVSTTLGLEKQGFQSEELRADRQITDYRHGTRQVNGDIVVEMSSGSHDDLFEAAMGGTWTANVLKAGTMRRSFTVERRFNDIAQFIRLKGVEYNGFSIQVQPNGIVRATFSTLGQDQEGAAAIITGATYGAATTTSTFDGFSGVIKEGGVAIATVTDIQMQLQNGLSPLFRVGSDKTRRPSIGRSNLTGTVTAYFEDRSLLDKFVSETESSLEFGVGAGALGMKFLAPRIKYTGGKPDVAGEGPVTIALPFQGLRDATQSSQLVITRTV